MPYPVPLALVGGSIAKIFLWKTEPRYALGGSLDKLEENCKGIKFLRLDLICLLRS